MSVKNFSKNRRYPVIVFWLRFANFKLNRNSLDVLRKKTNAGVYLHNTDYFSYVGKNFSGLGRYNSNFTYLNGRATTYYIHTYDDSYINSVSFGISGKIAGISASITNVTRSFTAYSGEKAF